MDDSTPVFTKNSDFKIWRTLCKVERSIGNLANKRNNLINRLKAAVYKYKLKKQIKEVCTRTEDVSSIILAKITSVADYYFPDRLGDVISDLLKKCSVDDSIFRINAAKLLISRERYDQAEAILCRINSISNVAEWEFVHGLINMHRGDINAAKKHFYKAYEFDDGYIPVYDGLCKVDSEDEWTLRKWMSTLFNGGVSVCRNITEIGPLSRLCNILVSMKDNLVGAVETIVNSVEYLSGNRDFVLAAARIYKIDKDYRRSICNYEKIIGEPDETFSIHLELADSYVCAGMIKEALYICDKLGSVCDCDRRLIEIMIRAYVREKDCYHLTNVVNLLLSKDYADLGAYITSMSAFIEMGMHSEASGLIARLEKLDDARIYYYQSLNDFKSTRLRSAELLARKACRKEPNNVTYKIHYARVCLATTGRFSKIKKNKAKNIVDTILLTDPRNRIALVLKKDLYESLNDYQAAYYVCEQILIDNPKDTNVLKNCAELLKKLGRKNDAIDMYRRALDIKEDSALFVEIISSLVSNGRNEDVVNFINEYSGSYEHIADVQVIKGNAQFALKRYTEAAKSYGKAVSTKYNNHVIWHSKGLAEEMAGDYESAEISFNKAVLMDLENPDYWISKALIQEKKEEYRSAVDSLNNVISIYPDNIFALVRKAMILARVGHERDALIFIDMAISIDANNVSIRKIKRDICVHLKMNDLAIATCKGILRNNPEDFDTILLLSKLYIVKKMYDKAIDELSKANHLKADSVEILALMYEVYSNLNMYEDAANICDNIFAMGQGEQCIKAVLENVQVRL
ncbi:MAG: tetratricopeptide repeat protein [archaeon]|nr:tetratricopeptide repeat protein [archaeon]